MEEAGRRRGGGGFGGGGGLRRRARRGLDGGYWLGRRRRDWVKGKRRRKASKGLRRARLAGSALAGAWRQVRRTKGEEWSGGEAVS